MGALFTINFIAAYAISTALSSIFVSLQALKSCCLPPQTARALEVMGGHLALARMRRKQSLHTWAQRIGVSVPTLVRMEAGDPSVAVGLVASALWLIGRDGELARVASPEHDRGALEQDVRAANALGKQRALAAQKTRATRAMKANKATEANKAAKA